MIKTIKNFLMHYTWDLAYGIYDETQGRFVDWSTVHYIKNPYKTKWFADPFILEEKEEFLCLLVEEFDSKVRKGRIAEIVVDKRTDKIIDCHIVLELDTHLSFPAIYRYDDKIYVLPENSRSGHCNIYIYDSEERVLKDPYMMIDEPLTDAIISENSGKYEMYSTSIPNPNGNILYKYQSESFLGPYSRDGYIQFDSNIARMAGEFIKIGNDYIRPAQDCNESYGKAVLLLKGKDIIQTIVPNKKKYAGIHTFNVNDKTFVIDLKKYDYPFIYYLRNLFKK